MVQSRVAYLNGEFLCLEEAKVPVLDRGLLFADGIYEVIAVLAGRTVDVDAHLARLDRSLGMIGIRNPHSPDGWKARQAELVRRNDLVEGLLYLQVTRGVGERDFAHPPADTAPTEIMFTQVKTIAANPLADTGAAVVTVPDLRWKRRDIKSVALLAQVIAKQQAVIAGASEAWMCEEGAVTEGSSSTAFIVVGDRLITRPLSTALLPSITRLAVLRLAREEKLIVEQRLFTVDEAKSADEAFYTSASALVMPVVRIDESVIGDGKPGGLSRRLRELYLAMAYEDGARGERLDGCAQRAIAGR